MPSSAPCSATILVADDDEKNRDLLSDILVAEGYKVTCAEDGERALQQIMNRAVDLALLDVIMPCKSGFEVCEAVKFNSETRLIPIVLVTGLSSVDERIRGIRSGADDFLSKPSAVGGIAT